MKRLIAGTLAVLLAGVALPGAALAQERNPAWMTGEWGVDAECTSTFGLHADGTVGTSDGGSTWRVEDTRLILVLDKETIAREFRKVSNDRIQLVDGPLLFRCDAEPERND